MKNFLVSLIKKSDWLLIFIIFAATLIRFYNFSDRVTFWSEQARSLVVSADYVQEKFSLLGQEYFRINSHGHKIFSGALFNYSLVPLLVISNYNPVIITGFFALLNIFIGLVIYLVVKRIFDRQLALVSTFVFLFNSTMIYHSLFIWNYNYLPLIGILTIYLTYLYQKSRQKKFVFFLGLVSGVGVSLQVLYAPILLLVLFLNIKKGKRMIKDSLLFIIGAAIGNIPMVIFDLRHDFYHLRAITQYVLDTLEGKSDAGFSYYYLLPFWPPLAIIVGWIILKAYKFNRLVGVFILLLYLVLNLSSKNVNFNNPTGMPPGLTVKEIDYASQSIAQDSQQNFNVSEVLDFDKRAYVLRYFIEYKYGKKPLGELEYFTPTTLYVLSQKYYNFEESGVWEIKANWPYEIEELVSVDQDYSIYKLTK